MQPAHTVTRAVFTLVLVACCISCGQERASRPASLPLLAPLKTHVLPVVFVENHSLPTLTDDEIKSILDLVTVKAFETLRLRVELSYAGRNQIADFFSQLPPSAGEQIKGGVYDFKRGKGDKALLLRGTAASLRQAGDDSAAARAYAAPYLIAAPTDASLTAFVDALVETQLRTLEAWRYVSGNDGKSVIDDSPQNEYTYWLALSVGAVRHELVLTNQLVASAEYLGNALHSALRGGVSNGFTNSAAFTKSGLTSIVSVYPFIAQDRLTKRLRDGEFPKKSARDEAIAMLVVHELGHQLLGLGHPFENDACVMNPPKVLHFKEWLANIDPAKCPLGSGPDMRPGRFAFPDLRKN